MSIARWMVSFVLLTQACGGSGASEQASEPVDQGKPQGSGASSPDAGSRDDSDDASGAEEDDDGSGDETSSDETDAGAGDDGGGAANTDSGVCIARTLKGSQVVPDMLVVLDRSGSMTPDGNTDAVDRWAGSVAGVKAVTSALENVVRFGLMTFPSVAAACEPGQLDVGIALERADAIATALDALSAEGSTPTLTTLDEAAKALEAAPLDGSLTPRPKHILLVTDGSPNCGVDLVSQCDFFDTMCIQQAAAQAETAQLELTVAKIQALATKGIKTHVIGFGTTSNATLSSALDMMATAGGTGRTSHWPVEDTQALIAAIDSVSADAIGCDLWLEQTVSTADNIQVRLDGTPLVAGDPDGFSLSVDRMRVIIHGAACQNVHDGNAHTLDLRVLCDP